MTNKTKIRKPQQKRSLEKQLKILQVAKELFAVKNYFIVTTNEIAKAAGLSIGTLYSYFSDKEAILLELLKNYNETFLDSIFKEINTPESSALFAENPRKWLQLLVDRLLASEDQAFHAQVEMLSYSIPQAKALLEDHQHRLKKLTHECLIHYTDSDEKDEELELLALLVFDFTSALVDELLYHQHTQEEFQRIKNLGIDSLFTIIQNHLHTEKTSN